MARAKKDGRHISYYIARDVLDDTKLYAATKRYPMTTAIEILLEKGLEAEAKARGYASKKAWMEHLNEKKSD